MDQVWRRSTLLMSRVLAVCNNLLIFRLHFFGIRLHLFFHPGSPPASLMFTNRQQMPVLLALTLLVQARQRVLGLLLWKLSTIPYPAVAMCLLQVEILLLVQKLPALFATFPVSHHLFFSGALIFHVVLDASICLFHTADVLWGWLHQNGSFQPSFAQLLRPLTFCTF